jgi:cell division protein FtsQ
MTLNPWHNIRQLHTAANVLFALAVVGVLAVAIQWVVHRPLFMLRAVTIEPARGTDLEYVSSALLRSSGLQHLRGSFFTVDLEAVRGGFESVPWVRRATVRRVWPDRLEVTIEEHRPMALWGDSRLMNTHGELFTANLDEAEDKGPLPQFAGPEGSHPAVLQRYAELGRWLAPLERKPVSVMLSPRYAWSTRLDDGSTLLLGRDQGVPIETRIARWVAVYPRVRTRLERQAEVVDLRYPNGFALRSATTVAGEGGTQPGAAVMRARHRR